MGKPMAYEYNPQKRYHTFYGHAGIGSRVVKEEMRFLRFSKSDIDHVSICVGLHMRAMEGITPKAARRMLKTLHEHDIGFRDLLRIRLADSQANLAKRPIAIADLKDMLHTFETENHGGSFTVKDLAVTGIDVMEVLGIVPGPRVGEVLRFLLDRLLEEGRDLDQRETLLALIAHKFKDT